MISNIYPRKMRQFPRTFMIEVCSNYDVINDLFGRQEDKNCHQVKMWPLTHQLVNKLIVLNFGLQNEAFAIYLGILVFISRSCSCSLFCNTYVLFVLISYLCLSFPFLYLVNFFLIYVLILFIYVSFFHYV